jgi:hypothetical protein
MARSPAPATDAPPATSGEPAQRLTESHQSCAPIVTHHRFAGMSRSAADAILDDMAIILARTFTPDVEIQSSWVVADFDSRRAQLRSHASAYMAYDGDRAVGYVAYQHHRLAGRWCINLLSACVLPEYQSKGLAFTMNARIFFRSILRRPWSSFFIAAHIVNPVALEGWRRRVHDPRDFFPQLDSRRPPRDRLVQAAREFAVINSPGLEFDSLTGVVSGRHLPGRRVEVRCGNGEIDRLYEGHVSGERGDTILMAIDASRVAILSELAEVVRAAPRAALVRLRSRVVE